MYTTLSRLLPGLFTKTKGTSDSIGIAKHCRLDDWVTEEQFSQFIALLIQVALSSHEIDYQFDNYLQPSLQIVGAAYQLGGCPQMDEPRGTRSLC